MNCPFYLKMGACRHGDRCSRIHNRPILSQTVLLQNMYLPPPQQYDPMGNPLPQAQRPDPSETHPQTDRLSVGRPATQPLAPRRPTRPRRARHTRVAPLLSPPSPSPASPARAQSEEELQDHFEEFYEDIFEELITVGGELEQLRVCENLSDHLAGNVYAKFRDEDDAQKALTKLMVRRA